jgi:transcription elongation factor Elf1
MLFVDTKYANMLSSRVRNFKKTNEYTWNFSCPFCGDSKTNARKARGYLHRKEASLYFKCHNCGVGSTLGKLINHVDTVMYKEYTLENYKEGVSKFSPHKTPDFRDCTPKFVPTLRDDTLKGLRRIDTMSPDHPAVKYVESRLIPKDKWNLLYFAPRWMKYVNGVKYTYPDSALENEHPRLVIPFFNEHGKVYAFQGRAFGNEEPRYMTVKLDDKMERIYGLERTNFERTVYAVEGPIDSLFLPNCIAVAGSSFDTAYMRGLVARLVVIFDNEPRNKDLCRQIEKCIKNGYSVCLFPPTVLQKDINDMIKVGGKTVDEIVNIINTNTFTGLEATVRFNEWRKCNES